MNEILGNKLRAEKLKMPKHVEDHLIEKSLITLIKAPPRTLAAFELNYICEEFVSSRLTNNNSRLLPVSPCSFLKQDDQDKEIINLKIYPKVAMFIILFKYSASYQYIWLLDSDLKFDRFNYKEFYRVHQCSFGLPPLVSQPVLDSAKHAFPFLTKTYWNQRSSKAIATKSGFIEIQAPFIDAAFFEWYLLAFVVPMFPPMNILGADWGFDELLCKAAELYDLETNPYILRHNKGKNHIVSSRCAVIIKSPVHHSDNKEMNHEVGGGNVKNLLSGILRQMIQQHYKRFYWTGSQETKKFLKPSSFRSLPYAVITKFPNENCEVDYKQSDPLS
jgi:hypothetical protein